MNRLATYKWGLFKAELYLGKSNIIESCHDHHSYLRIILCIDLDLTTALNFIFLWSDDNTSRKVSLLLYLQYDEILII